jgi:hypothetical protein
MSAKTCIVNVKKATELAEEKEKQLGELGKQLGELTPNQQKKTGNTVGACTSVLGDTAIGEDGAASTVLLLVLLARAARLARVHHATNACPTRKAQNTKSGK